jgi:hypothetical protein
MEVWVAGQSSLSAKTEANAMKDKTKEVWEQFCERATVEQDPDKLIKLVAEINRMLEEKDHRLKPTRRQE